MTPNNPQQGRRDRRESAALKTVISLTIVVALLAALLSLTPSPTKADLALDSVESEFLTLLNEYRAQHGQPPLITDDRLNAAADWFAHDMAIDGYFAYDHYDNEDPPRSPSERAAAFGFNAPVGENLAAGFSTAKAVLDAWKASPGHNNNLLGNYVVIGIGRAHVPGSYYGVYWVADFSPWNPPSAATASPTPHPTPSATPTPVPTPHPTPTPATATIAPTTAPDTATPTQNITQAEAWGDTDCDGSVDPVDSVRIMRLDAGLDTSSPPGCPVLGDGVMVSGTARVWGDVNCSGDANSVDALLTLRHDAGYGIDQPAGCPDIGAPF